MVEQVAEPVPGRPYVHVCRRQSPNDAPLTANAGPSDPPRCLPCYCRVNWSLRGLWAPVAHR